MRGGCVAGCGRDNMDHLRATPRRLAARHQPPDQTKTHRSHPVGDADRACFLSNCSCSSRREDRTCSCGRCCARIGRRMTAQGSKGLDTARRAHTSELEGRRVDRSVLPNSPPLRVSFSLSVVALRSAAFGRFVSDFCCAQPLEVSRRTVRAPHAALKLVRHAWTRLHMPRAAAYNYQITTCRMHMLQLRMLAAALEIDRS